MPESWNGIGTGYVGKRDFHTDGSYTTTEWFTAFWIPIIPVRSQRVLPLGEGEGGFFTLYSFRYSIIEELPLCWKQIGCVYLYMFTLFASFVISVLNPTVGITIILVTLIAPVVLRVRAKRRLARH